MTDRARPRRLLAHRGALAGSIPVPEGLAQVIARRLEQFVSELGVERGRVRGWGVVHALAWGLTEETAHPDLLSCAELLAAV
jgi:hypothetical protein